MNSILAGAASGNADCVDIGTADRIIDRGHNLIGVNACASILDGRNGNLAGKAATPVNPDLGPLQNNGGPTPTEPLTVGQPTIDAGDYNGCFATQSGARSTRRQP